MGLAGVEGETRDQTGGDVGYLGTSDEYGE